MKLKRAMVLIAVVALAAAACGGGDEESDSTTAKLTTTTSETSEATSTTEGESGSVSSLEAVRGATIRIVAEGSFVDPQYGQQYNSAGSGSGFFISPDGIAVTNNHVVTGAAFLQVYVDGEDAPRNAKILGVSECSDLAVIDVEGDGYPYLDWYDGDIAVGTQIYAAGFPLGVEEYTLLDGIISKEDADGESDWSSVDSVIEHSADTLPGNSGGPIVTADGAVIAVNYAGDSVGQSYGVGRDEALKVLPALMGGDNVTSIGINGLAVTDGALSGIFVSSVASGSPADMGGIESGDVVTLIEGLIPATDGTMADYCDILRSHDPGDPLSVEVYRAADDAFYEGTLNTDQVMELSYSFASELGDEVVNDGATVAGYDSYTTLVDAQNILTVDVPEAWIDVDTETLWGNGETIFGVAIWAATDYASWDSGWDTPGMFFGASPVLAQTETVESFLAKQDFSSNCVYDAQYDYSDALYSGVYNVWTDCGGGDTLLIDLAAETAASDVLMNVQVVVVTDADLEALDFILNTFVVDEVALADFSGSATSSSGSTGETLGSSQFESLWDGDCFNVSGGSFDQVTYGVEVDTVACDSTHVGEIYGNYFFEGTDYPGESVAETTANDYCASQFSEYVGNTWESSSLDFWYYYPTESGWNDEGITWSMCALVDYGGGMLTGSAYQSGW